MAAGRGRRGGRALRLTTALLASLALVGCADEPRPRNAVLIVLDTLRADRLSAYGAERPTSPRIDALAEQGVLFERAVTNAPWTLPALVGLLSARYPSAREYRGGLRKSLIESLHRAGWTTAAFTEGGFASRFFGMHRGFDHFHELELQAAEGVSENPSDIEDTFERARAWLRQNREERFFLLVHTYETHLPYRRRHFAQDLERGRLEETFEVGYAMGVRGMNVRLSQAELAYVRALYDGGVRSADAQVGSLLDTLESLGLAEETLVVVTSDHGEDLGQRDPWDAGTHGHSLYDEQLLVPLVIRDPTRRPRVSRVPYQVRSVDVLPTVLEILGVPVPSDLHGRSLVSLMNGEEAGHRPAWARRALRPGWQGPVLRSLRTGDHKLVVAAPDPEQTLEAEAELYDLRADPGEREDLAETEPALRQELLRRLEALSQEIEEQGVPAYLSSAQAHQKRVRAQLRALGYLGD